MNHLVSSTFCLKIAVAISVAVQIVGGTVQGRIETCQLLMETIGFGGEGPGKLSVATPFKLLENMENALSS